MQLRRTTQDQGNAVRWANQPNSPRNAPLSTPRVNYLSDPAGTE